VDINTMMIVNSSAKRAWWWYCRWIASSVCLFWFL